jgi:hypothetical protein
MNQNPSSGNVWIKLSLGDHRQAISTHDLGQIFVAAAARVTAQNWNKNGYTFFIIMTEDKRPLYLDNFELPNFLEDCSISLEHYPNLLKLLLEHQDHLQVDLLYEDEEEDDEWVYEALLTAPESDLKIFDDPLMQARIINVVQPFLDGSTPFESEIAGFILRSLGR